MSAPPRLSKISPQYARNHRYGQSILSYLDRKMAGASAAALSTANTAAMMSLSRVQATPQPRAASNESAINSSCLESTSTALPSARAYCPHVHPRVLMSDANTLRTSDWEIPNCRAIKDGLIPALNEARTALIWPRVNVTVSDSACRLPSVRGDCFDVLLSALTLGTGLPRRCASSTDAATNRSSSRSLRCLTALGKSLGRTYRRPASADSNCPRVGGNDSATRAGGSGSVAAGGTRFPPMP
jgi:hypothetical protein